MGERDLKETHIYRPTRSSGIIMQLHTELTASLMNRSVKMLTERLAVILLKPIHSFNSEFPGHLEFHLGWV